MFRRQTRPKNKGTQVLVLYYDSDNNFQRFKKRMAAENLADKLLQKGGIGNKKKRKRKRC